MGRRPNIFLAAFQRTGSTHLAVTLARLLNYNTSSTVARLAEPADDAHIINPFMAQVLFTQHGLIFHQHTLGTSDNVYLLKSYEMPPVVMMSNVLDCMVSLRESLNKGPQKIGIYVPKCWAEMPESEQYDWLACNVAPWFFTFYVSWLSAPLDKLVVWYEDYYADQVKWVRKILDHTGLSQHGTATDETIADCARVGDSSRFNVGISGRGVNIPERALDMVYKQAISWGPEWYGKIKRDLIEGEE